MSDRGGTNLVLNLAESLTLSVTAAVASCGLAMASGGGVLLGVAAYVVVGSITLISACSISAVEERVRVARALRETQKERAYA